MIIPSRKITTLGLLLALLLAGTACNNDPPPVKPIVVATQTQPQTDQTQAKRTPLGKNVYFEIDKQTGQRRVIVSSTVVLREGQLEGFLTISHAGNDAKTHEYILSTTGDALEIHNALIAAKAVAGSPVMFGKDRQYKPASGSTIKVSVQYKQRDGKLVTVPAQNWIRNSITKKPFEHDWVFGGSRLIPDPENPNRPPFYEANIGDVICVCNMPSAMLDITVLNPNSEPESRVFQAFTERIPPLGTRVDIILEPVPGKEDKNKDKPQAENKESSESKDPPKDKE
jgi:hypothetical protein